MNGSLIRYDVIVVSFDCCNLLTHSALLNFMVTLGVIDISLYLCTL